MKTFPQPVKRFPFAILALATAIVIVDYLTGPYIRCTILYVIPIALAAWKWRIVPALGLAVAMPLCRLGFAYEWDVTPSFSITAINTAIQCLTLIGITLLLARPRSLQEKVHDSEGVLPICCFCKKIQTSEKNWEGVEDYVAEKSGANFSHTYCPACVRRHFPDFLETGRSSK